MCAMHFKWSSRYLPVYMVCTEWMLVCAHVRILLINEISSSSALAVAGKELIEQQLKRLVLSHDVVLAQVVAAGGAGVHLRSKRPLKASLTKEDSRGLDIRIDFVQLYVTSKVRLFSTHLANVV